MSPTRLELLLKRDRAVVLGAIVAVAALAWAYVIWLAASMAAAPSGTAMPGMEMSGTDMPGMDGALAPALRGWSVGEFAFMFAMWAIMMVGMMLPSVAPMLLVYAGVARQAGSRGKPFAATAWFAAGYLLVWVAFSMLATAAQWVLETVLLLTPMSGLGARLGGVVLIAAGIYQCTPLKDVCLSACQSPLQFIMRHGGFRSDRRGAINLGIEHGAYCIGCCWALMAILFVVGIMNLLWVAAIAAFILAEKVLPVGHLVSRAAGAVLIVTGAWILV
ncbi:DUF2182 domain-containing protein [Aminobacter aganoensis]|uniref:Putative metal-binding membrane protein n=1 Tax=Aminobacter aganoensis TaxID=83264 RepID=A0A7X0F8F3_9HYPH|nr:MULTISPECIES: DUF2182 domain-containing protein [Aminobacter]KQU76603.1 metal-binding protein [Aminobacter sp. DSM 101952]MBB6354965.1 putative metal-binding membrane protein [Aminobacter aganoensis]